MADAVELQGLNAKLANKITLAARMRTGYNEAAANFYRLSFE